MEDLENIPTVCESENVEPCANQECEHTKCEPDPENIPEIKEESIDANAETCEAADTELDKPNEEYRQEVLEKVEYYENHLEELKFTKDDIKGMVKAGIFDYDTAKAISDIFNDDIDDIITGMNEEGQYYSDPVVRKNSIAAAIGMKLSLIDLKANIDDIAREMTPEKLALLYDALYPGYKDIRSAIILKAFLGYLENRVKNEKELNFVAKEMLNVEKLKKIASEATENIFNHMYSTNLENFSIRKFGGNLYLWNAQRLATMTGKSLSNNKDWAKVYSDELLIFTSLFSRFIYKHYLKDLENNPMQRNLFREFIMQNARLNNQPEPVKNAMSEAWDKIFTIIINQIIPHVKLLEK